MPCWTTQAEAVWWRTMSRGSEPVSSSSAERYLPLKPTRRPPPCHLYHPASLSMSRTATPKHTHTHNLTSFDRKMFTNLCFKKNIRFRTSTADWSPCRKNRSPYAAVHDGAKILTRFGRSKWPSDVRIQTRSMTNYSWSLTNLTAKYFSITKTSTHNEKSKSSNPTLTLRVSAHAYGQQPPRTC